jgi:hypothetical protein
MSNPSTGGHVWARRYDRDRTDVFAIQDEITHEIVMAMQVQLTDGEVARIELGATPNLDAWDAFHQGVLALHFRETPLLFGAALFHYWAARACDLKMNRAGGEPVGILYRSSTARIAVSPV